MPAPTKPRPPPFEETPQASLFKRSLHESLPDNVENLAKEYLADSKEV